MERRQHNKRDLKRRRLEEQNSDAISNLYVPNVITAEGKCFYDNSVLRAATYKRTGKVKDDDDVDGRERTVTTSDDMNENDNTSAYHERDIVSCIKGGYESHSFVNKKESAPKNNRRRNSRGRAQ